MKNNASNGADEMNKSTEYCAKAGSAVGPAVDEVLSLREAAKQLARLAPSKKGEQIADEKLLRFLRAGKVRAGFHAPGDKPVWVQIPRNYWMKVSAASFKKIRVDPRNRRKGDYNVFLESFPAEYAEARISTSKQALSAAELLLEFVRHGEIPLEVMLPTNEWDQFKTELPAPNSKLIQEQGRKSKSGRNELLSWKDVNAILAAYIMKRRIVSSDDESCASIAENVLSIAKRTKEHLRLPSVATMEKEIGRVLAMANSSEFRSVLPVEK